eukprot:1145029-Pelagomonas_calceolata.AAC.1
MRKGRGQRPYAQFYEKGQGTKNVCTVLRERAGTRDCVHSCKRGFEKKRAQMQAEGVVKKYTRKQGCLQQWAKVELTGPPYPTDTLRQRSDESGLTLVQGQDQATQAGSNIQLNLSML